MRSDNSTTTKYPEELERCKKTLYEQQAQVSNLETEVLFYIEKQRITNRELEEIRLELKNLLEGDS